MSLGSIVVRLTMNTADFDTDAGRAAKIAERRAKEIDAAFKKAGVAIGVALGAAVAIGTRALQATIDKMDETSKAAQKVGLPTEEFSRLAYAGDLADVSMDTMVSTLGKLVKAQAAAIDKTSEQSRVFAALGIDAIDPLTGQMRESSDVLLDFADRFQTLKGSPEAMAAGFVLFGRSFQDMIPLLKDGSAGIREAAAESDALGNTLSTEAGQAAEEFNDNLTRLQTAAGGLAREVAGQLLPELIGLTEKAIDVAREGDLAAEAADGLTAAFDGIVSISGSVLTGLESIRSILSGVSGDAQDASEQIRQLSLSAAALAAIPASMAAFLEANTTFDPAKRAAADARFKAEREKVRKGFNPGPPPPDFSNVVGGSATFVSEESRLAADVARIREQQEYARKLREALGTQETGGGKSKKAALTEEQKAAKELQQAYEGLTGSMAERIALFGQETELAKVNYEIQSGSLQGLAEAEQAKLRQQAIELDNLALQEEGRRLLEASLEPFERVNAERERARDLLEAGAIAQDEYNRVIRDLRTPAEEMLEDMQFELELLGKTREEQELLTAARWLGAEAATAQGQAALAAMKEQQEAAKAMEDQIALMDAFRDEAASALTDFVTGAKSAKEALTDFFDNLAAMVTRMIAERWMEQLFGQRGSSGQGTAGGDWLSGILGAFLGGGTSAGSTSGSASMLSWMSGGYSRGGFTGYGGVMEPAGVVHRGEVVWSQGDVARAGGVSAVESMRRGGGGTRFQQSVHVTIQGRPDRRTPGMVARETGKAARRELART